MINEQNNYSDIAEVGIPELFSPNLIGLEPFRFSINAWLNYRSGLTALTKTHRKNPYHKPHGLRP